MLNRNRSVSLILQEHLMHGWGCFCLVFLIQAAANAAKYAIAGVYITCQMIMSSKRLQTREAHNKSMGETCRPKVCSFYLFVKLIKMY